MVKRVNFPAEVIIQTEGLKSGYLIEVDILEPQEKINIIKSSGFVVKKYWLGTTRSHDTIYFVPCESDEDLNLFRLMFNECIFAILEVKDYVK